MLINILSPIQLSTGGGCALIYVVIAAFGVQVDILNAHNV